MHTGFYVTDPGNPFAMSVRVEIGLQDFGLSWDTWADTGACMFSPAPFSPTSAHAASSAVLDIPGLKFSNQSIRSRKLWRLFRQKKKKIHGKSMPRRGGRKPWSISPKDDKSCRLADVTTVTGLLFRDAYRCMWIPSWTPEFCASQARPEALGDAAFPVAAVLPEHPEAKTHTN